MLGHICLSHIWIFIYYDTVNEWHDENAAMINHAIELVESLPVLPPFSTNIFLYKFCWRVSITSLHGALFPLNHWELCKRLFCRSNPSLMFLGTFKKRSFCSSENFAPMAEPWWHSDCVGTILTSCVKSWHHVSNLDTMCHPQRELQHLFCHSVSCVEIICYM
jgi:hypothetical protein